MSRLSAEDAVRFATFDVFRADDAITTRALANEIAEELSAVTRHAPGFARARVHTELDSAVVVAYVAWSGEPPPDAGLKRFAGRPGVASATTFCGVPKPGLSGPAADCPPAIAAIATRYLPGQDAADELLGLLAASGEWKRGFPGFIAAVPYLSQDGTVFVNYPMWVDETAYQAWMADPRISSGQRKTARLEVAPPEYLVCLVVSEILPP